MILTWQPYLSDHQAYTFAALMNVSGGEVVCNVISDVDNVRFAQGWTNEASKKLDVRLVKSFHQVLVSLFRYKSSTHVFCSPFDKFQYIFALYLCSFLRLKYFIVSEPYCDQPISFFGPHPSYKDRLKYKIRPLLYSFYGKTLSRNCAGVFAISELAYKQYCSIGFARRKVFDYGYFVPDQGYRALNETHGRRLRAIFVGSLIHTKGFDLLIEAVQRINHKDIKIQLDLYSPSIPENIFENENFGVKYAGSIPFGNAQRYMADYDFLVLPSRYDGWGVVVNEAICANIPVICSDRVGAKRLVNEYHCGIVYESGITDALFDALNSIANAPCILDSYRANISKARVAIQPIAAANFMWKKITETASL